MRQTENAAPVHGIHRAGRRREDGIVLLLVVFLAAAIFISMAAVLPRIVMQGRREKEAELAWRGEQYVRAIKLYYRKYGHFPRDLDDFSKNPGNLHFLRKEYTDPMNSADGKWRFIYVGPGGQLIGSVTRTLPLGVVPLTAGAPNPFGSNANASAGGQAGFGSAPNAGQGGFSGFGQAGTLFGGNSPSGTAPSGTTPSGSQGQTAQSQPATPPATGDNSSGTDTSADDSGDKPLPPAPVAPNQGLQNASPMDSTVFGGQLVGVGSKVDQKSIRFYKGYGKYREWEFIWDPAAEAAAAAGLAPAAPAPGGQLPGGLFPSAPQPTGTTPPNPPQNNPPQ